MTASIVLLPTAEVTLYAPDGETDTHGWTLPPEPIPYWTGQASVQISFGTASAGAESAGGTGPFAPAANLAGVAYLPQVAQPRDGMVLMAAYAAAQYVLSSCRWVPDPSGGDLGCYACTLISRDDL